MPRFAANLSMLFTEVPFLDRFERAARAGFETVECQFPYAHPAAEVAARLKGNRLTMVLHNLPPGDAATGERGLACLPDRVDAFRASVVQGIEYATALGVTQLHCMSGLRPAGVSDAVLKRTWLTNLRHAAAELKKAGLRLLIEPINARDVPGYYVNRTDQALALMDEVDAANVFLLYDVYHAQRSEGELAATLSRHLARIGHVQVADNPGRHEPGSGEINFPFLFAHLDAIGYAGHVGCEYTPARGTEAGLKWLEAARRQLKPRVGA